MRRPEETIAAVATPPGEGGIAIVRVSGGHSHSIAAQVFRPVRADNPLTYPGYTVRYGRIVEPKTQEVLDDGLLTLFRAPHSYTGEDSIEIACHGGRAVTSRVLQAVLQAGARLAEPGEFTLRAFLNGRIDLAQAEAVADLIRAKTESARRLARIQLEGSLSHAVAAIKDELVGILAAIEATIDFSDEVGELDYPPLLKRISLAKSRISSLLQTAEKGRILREGLRVAIVGRPNVGKSSLLNALLRTDRAIVTPIAGTTRDIVEESANIAGVAVVLVDTAGIRETEDVVERIGVERAHTAAETADVILFVVDVEIGWTDEEETLLSRLHSAEVGHLLCVLNKCDKVSENGVQAIVRQLSQSKGSLLSGFVPLSATSGQGLDTLETALLTLIGGTPDSTNETATVANVRHYEALQAAQSSVTEAERTALLLLPGDFIAIDVRGALDALGRITGETVTEEIIHRIFHDFCVGK